MDTILRYGYYGIFFFISGVIHYYLCFDYTPPPSKVEIPAAALKAIVEVKKELEKLEQSLPPPMPAPPPPEEKKPEESTPPKAEEKKPEEKKPEESAPPPKPEEKKPEEKKPEPPKPPPKPDLPEDPQQKEKDIKYLENLEQEMVQRWQKKMAELEQQKKKEVDQIRKELAEQKLQETQKLQAEMQRQQQQQQEMQRQQQQEMQKQQQLNQQLAQQLAVVTQKLAELDSAKQKEIQDIKRKQDEQLEQIRKDQEVKLQQTVDQKLAQMQRQQQEKLATEQKKYQALLEQRDEKLAQMQQTQEAYEKKVQEMQTQQTLARQELEQKLALERQQREAQQAQLRSQQAQLQSQIEKQQQLERQVLQANAMREQISSSSGSVQQERTIIDEQWKSLEQIQADTFAQHQSLVQKFTTNFDKKGVAVPALSFFDDTFEHNLDNIMAFHKMVLIAYPQSNEYFITIDLSKSYRGGRYEKRMDFQNFFRNYSNRSIAAEAGFPRIVEEIRNDASLYHPGHGQLSLAFIFPRNTADYMAWKSVTVCKKFGYDPQQVAICYSRFKRTRTGFWSLIIKSLQLRSGQIVQVQDFEENW